MLIPMLIIFFQILFSKHNLLSLFFAIIGKKPACFCQQKRVNGRVCHCPIVTLFILAPSGFMTFFDCCQKLKTQCFQDFYFMYDK